MDNRLHDKLGTCKTSFKVNLGDRITEPFPAMAEREPSAILILWLPAQGL